MGPVLIFVSKSLFGGCVAFVGSGVVGGVCCGYSAGGKFLRKNQVGNDGGGGSLRRKGGRGRRNRNNNNNNNTNTNNVLNEVKIC